MPWRGGVSNKSVVQVGDHDVPYHFALPLSLPQVLAWMRLLGKVQRGEVEL